MQFKFQIFLTFLFAAFALATPAANAKIAAREAAMNELMDGVLESRADITSFLGQLTGLLPGKSSNASDFIPLLTRHSTSPAPQRPDPQQHQRSR